jgi:hypothetical protein
MGSVRRYDRTVWNPSSQHKISKLEWYKSEGPSGGGGKGVRLL